MTRSLPGGRRKRITVRLSRRALSAARRALARRKRVTVTVRVTATDARGNSVVARNIRLKRG